LNNNKELYAFIGDYNQRKQKGLDNYWIIKPPNMARSMDMVVTDNLYTILRLLEVGPRLAQKYILNPITVQKKKFDLRMYIIVRSVNYNIIVVKA
jgi:tubulin--tyrosine ligase-like protein 12